MAPLIPTAMRGTRGTRCSTASQRLSASSGKGHGFEMNLALIGTALDVLVGGAGAIAIDRIIHPW